MSGPIRVSSVGAGWGGGFRACACSLCGSCKPNSRLSWLAAEGGPTTVTPVVNSELHADPAAAADALPAFGCDEAAFARLAHHAELNDAPNLRARRSAVTRVRC